MFLKIQSSSLFNFGSCTPPGLNSRCFFWAWHTQLLASFHSITPALHASVNFSPDWFKPAILSTIKSQITGWFTPAAPESQSICLTRRHRSTCAAEVNGTPILWSTNEFRLAFVAQDLEFYCENLSLVVYTFGQYHGKKKTQKKCCCICADIRCEFNLQVALIWCKLSYLGV